MLLPRHSQEVKKSGHRSSGACERNGVGRTCAERCRSGCDDVVLRTGSVRRTGVSAVTSCARASPWAGSRARHERPAMRSTRAAGVEGCSIPCLRQAQCLTSKRGTESACGSAMRADAVESEGATCTRTKCADKSRRPLAISPWAGSQTGQRSG